MVIKVLKNNPNFKIVNLTACAPEMNLNFRWFVAKVSELDIKIIVRSNLTIIKANKKHNDLPDFFKLHKIEIILNSFLLCFIGYCFVLTFICRSGNYYILVVTMISSCMFAVIIAIIDCRLKKNAAIKIIDSFETQSS